MPPSKRRRRTDAIPAFGAAHSDDLLSGEPGQIPSASALSVRTLPWRGPVPALSTLCARRFVDHIVALSSDERLWEQHKASLKRLPDHVVPKLFEMLQRLRPSVLSHGFIVLYFLRGSSLLLSRELPGVQRQTILSAAKNDALRELRLIGFDAYQDSSFASLLASLPQLRVLVLRGCSQVGVKTALAAATCTSLVVVNFNYTAVPPVSVADILLSCDSLQVLKVAGIPSWRDGMFTNLLYRLPRTRTFSDLQNLKLRQLALSDASVQPFLVHFPNLRRLDISFTKVRRNPFAKGAAPPLEKLALTSLSVPKADLVELITSSPGLRTLYLGALDNGPTVSLGDLSSKSMRDATLELLTPLFESMQLEKVSLAGNSRLGMSTGNELTEFISKVGRRCKHLNLSGLQHLTTRHLQGLHPRDDDLPWLEELILSHTGIDDSSLPRLAWCARLVTLKLAGTKISSPELSRLVNSCQDLERLDLTSCRGVSVSDRRRFFETIGVAGLGSKGSL